MKIENWFIFCSLSAALLWIGAVGYVAVHFIIKFW
jgi:hypothetical protein